MAAPESAEFTLVLTTGLELEAAEVWSLSGVRSSDTIQYLKTVIFWNFGILQDDQYIFTYKSELLEDGKTLADYNLNAKMKNLILLKTYEEYLSCLANAPLFEDDVESSNDADDEADDDADDEDVDDHDNVQPETPSPLKNCFADVAPPSDDEDDDDDDDADGSPPLKKRKHDDDDDDDDDVCGSATSSSDVD